MSSATPSPGGPTARKSVKGSGHLGMMTGRRNRQETMLSIRKAKKEDAYATRRNLKSNHPGGRAAAVDAARDTASRKELLQNLAQRSHALLLGMFYQCSYYDAVCVSYVRGCNTDPCAHRLYCGWLTHDGLTVHLCQRYFVRAAFLLLQAFSIEMH